MSILGEAIVVIRGDMSKLPADLKGAGSAVKAGLAHLGGSDFAKVMEAGFTGAAIATTLVNKAMEIASAAQERWNMNLEHGIELAKHESNVLLRLKASLEATGYSSGKTSKELVENAARLQDLTGTNSEDIVRLQTKLVFFSKIQGEVFDRATHAAIEWSEAMGTDAASAAHILGRSLNDPLRGTMMLTRMGVQLSEQQRKQVKDFMSLNEVAKAQGIILDALERKYGRFAENAMTPTKRLKNELDDAYKEIGRVAKQGEPLKLKAKIIEVTFQAAALQQAQEHLNLLNWHGMGANASSAGRVLGSAGYNTGLSTIIGPTGQAALDSLAWLKGRYDRPWKEAEKLEETRQENEARRKRNIAADMKATRDKTEGIFDPMQFQKRLQESLLGKNDKMLEAEQSQVHLLEDMLTELRNGNAGGGDGAPTFEP